MPMLLLVTAAAMAPTDCVTDSVSPDGIDSTPDALAVGICVADAADTPSAPTRVQANAAISGRTVREKRDDTLSPGHVLKRDPSE